MIVVDEGVEVGGVAGWKEVRVLEFENVVGARPHAKCARLAALRRWWTTKFRRTSRTSPH
jgi:hypothetical protein